MQNNKIQAFPITASSVVCNCGVGKKALYQAIVGGKTALTRPTLFAVDFPAFVGEVNAEHLPQLDPDLKDYSTRNSQIALACLNHEDDGLRRAISVAKQRYGASRIGIVLGTSTSGIYETENAYINIEKTGQPHSEYNFSTQHVWVATSRFLQRELQLQGPCYVISTACSSSSKSIASAQRLIAAGVCDAVIAGGVDSLCRMTLHGFQSLDLISGAPCTPLDQHRSGISLGEGAGLVLVERARDEFSQCPHLLGAGESSDAHHMTAPHPQGEGAVIAMKNALLQADKAPDQIDYLNLHATGTPKNDQAELIAVNKIFGEHISCSGTKGLTGHTLGAAGGIEAIIALLSLHYDFQPGTCGLEQVDAEFNCTIVKQSLLNKSMKTAMSNNYGFGGNNSSLIFGKLDG